MKKLVMLFPDMSTAGVVCRADYELRLNDGVMLRYASISQGLPSSSTLLIFFSSVAMVTGL